MPDRVILWTRVSVSAPGDLSLNWDVAADANFGGVVARGTVNTGPQQDYTAKVDVKGLLPGNVYYYRFYRGTDPSPTGRTKTLPVGTVSQAKIAVLSCANFPAGYFNVYADVAKRFEAANPGTKVEMQFLENEAYKKKLTTLLQSPDKPHIIYSWAGGVLREQVKAGVIEDISDAVNAGGWKDRFSPSALNLYAVDGRTYGVPMLTSQVVFFYNNDLFAKAGVDGNAIKSWDDLLGAVKKLHRTRGHDRHAIGRRRLADRLGWPSCRARRRPSVATAVM